MKFGSFVENDIFNLKTKNNLKKIQRKSVMLNFVFAFD